VTDTEAFDERVKTELAPELTVLRTLGRGSVASVYLAHEPELDRQVAVKVLQPIHAADQTNRRRFEREARSAARINHPNVTAVFRVGRLSNELPFLVMEFVEGRNLEDELAATSGLSVAAGRDVLRQLAAGLAAAHAQGVIHRDVKPANVLMEKETGRVVLTDFGLAAAKDRSEDTTKLTMVGQVLGSLEYVSPEHLAGKSLTELADVYALGVLGYHVLLGRGPYAAAKSAAAITVAHMRGEPLSARSLRGEIDPALSNLLGRCLAKRPEHRPTACEIAEELEDGPGRNDEKSARAAGPDTAFGQFMVELKRRRVYKVGAAYLAFVVAIISIMDGVESALQLTPEGSRTVLAIVLAGLPVTLALSWMFDLRAEIERTPDAGTGGGPRDRAIPAIALILSLVLAALVWWGVQRLG